MCKFAKVGAVHQDKLNPGETDDPGVVREVKKPWVVNVLLNETPMEFHIDTGAEVTVISDLIFHKLHDTTLLPSTRILWGPSQEALPVRGQFKGKIRIDD